MGRRREEEKGKGKRKETSIFREMKDFPSPFQQPLHLNNTHRLIPLFHTFNFEERKERDEKRKKVKTNHKKKKEKTSKRQQNGGEDI